MKRRWWFLGLFAPQVVAQNGMQFMGAYSNCQYDGQTGRLLTPSCEHKSRDRNGVWSDNPIPTRIPTGPRPANNECPVCGTMAAPYSIASVVKARNGMGPCLGSPIGFADVNGISTIHANCVPSTEREIPKSRMARCAHCSAAFWQDAEK